MRVETPGEWVDRDAFQLRPLERFIDDGLVDVTVVGKNELSEPLAA